MGQKSSPASPVSQQRSAAWPPFAEKLAAVLSALEEDLFLIIAVKRTNRFVQFAAQGGFGLRAETTSNHYLPKSERLDAQEIAALRAAGWAMPTGDAAESTPEQDPDGSPNFFIQFAAPVSSPQVAETAVHTLADVLQIPYPGFLEYEAFDADGRALVLPALGLKRAVPPTPRDEEVPTPQKLREALRRFTELADLDFDTDGDIGLAYGDLVVYVSLLGTPPLVRLQTRLLTGIAETPALLARLNAINAGDRHLHLCWQRDALFAVADIPAELFVEAHLTSVLHYFCEITEGLDGLLQSELGREDSGPDAGGGYRH